MREKTAIEHRADVEAMAKIMQDGLKTASEYRAETETTGELAEAEKEARLAQDLRQVAVAEIPLTQLQPPASISDADAALNPMTATIQAIIEDVAQAMENKLGYVGAVKTQGGPYATSLTLVAERRLRDAAAAAMEVIITHPALRPQSN